MSIGTRALALQGIGFAALLVAVQGIGNFEAAPVVAAAQNKADPKIQTQFRLETTQPDRTRLQAMVRTQQLSNPRIGTSLNSERETGAVQQRASSRPAHVRSQRQTATR